MKLLFDENLSPKLPHLLAAAFPGSMHVRDCGLKGSTDSVIWSYARANGFTLVSKDSDFCQRNVLYGQSPKLVWLRIGNCTRDTLLSLLKSHESEINALDTDSNQFVLVIS
jgi:predicted nuclease of predicted toxin-antitoxin system